jgi:hypothetical protein
MKDVKITAYYCPNCGQGYGSNKSCPACHLELKFGGLGMILAGVIGYALSLILFYKFHYQDAQDLGMLCLFAGLIMGYLSVYNGIKILPYRP